MNLIQWDPWKELEQLRARTDRLWDEFLAKLTGSASDPTRIGFLPDVDLVESGREYRIYLAVPGLIEEDIDLSIGTQILTVRGEREAPYDTTHSRRELGEWRYGFFERSIQFANPINPAGVRATYDAGVLTIVLPKA